MHTPREAVAACGNFIRLQERILRELPTANPYRALFEQVFGDVGYHLLDQMAYVYEAHVCDWFMGLDSDNAAKFVAHFK